MAPRFVVDLIDTEQDLFDIPRKVSQQIDSTHEAGAKSIFCLLHEGTRHLRQGRPDDGARNRTELPR